MEQGSSRRTAAATRSKESLGSYRRGVGSWVLLERTVIANKSRVLRQDPDQKVREAVEGILEAMNEEP